MNLTKFKTHHRHIFVAVMATTTLSIFVIVGGLINNHRVYEELNAAMLNVNLQPYEQENKIVSKQTLSDMENQIYDKLYSIYGWVDLEIGFTTEQSDRIFETLSDDSLTEVERLEIIDHVMIEAFNGANYITEQNIQDNLDSGLDYTPEEQDVYNNINSNYNYYASSKTLSVKDAYDKYISLNYLNGLLEELNSSTQSRLDQEALEAQIEADRIENERLEQEKAEEEAAEAKRLEEEQAALSASAYSGSVASGSFDRGFANAVFVAVNNYRSANGLSPLSYNSSMQTCSDNEAKAMASTNSFHNGACVQPWGGAEIEYYSSNSTLSTTTIINSWAADPAHRNQMLGNYSSASVSAYSSGGNTYVVVNFW